MKIVLDTNLLVSGIFWSGAPLKILEHWRKEKLQVLATENILDEYLRVIEKISVKAGRPDLFLAWSALLPMKLDLILVKKSFKLCRDPDDDKFIDCAVAGKAEYIVSGDDDLLSLKKVMQIEIATARDFLKVVV